MRASLLDILVSMSGFQFFRCSCRSRRFTLVKRPTFVVIFLFLCKMADLTSTCSNFIKNDQLCQIHNVDGKNCTLASELSKKENKFMMLSFCNFSYNQYGPVYKRKAL